MHHVFYNQEDALRSLREISIMRQCHHPNICKIIDAYIPKDKDTFNSVWVVMVHSFFPRDETGVWRLGPSKDYGNTQCDWWLECSTREVSHVPNDLRPSLSQCIPALSLLSNRSRVQISCTATSNHPTSSWTNNAEFTSSTSASRVESLPAKTTTPSNSSSPSPSPRPTPWSSNPMRFLA